MMHERPIPAGQPINVVYKPVFLVTLQAVLGVLAGFFDIIAGVFAILTFGILCIIDGILMLLIGCAVVTLETPFNCAFFPFMEKVNNFTAQRTAMQRAIMYMVLGLLQLLMCLASVMTILAGIFLFATGFLYVWKWYQDRQMGNSPTLDTTPQAGSGMGGGGPMYTGVGGNDQIGGFAATAGGMVASRPDLVEKAASGAVHGYMAHQQQRPPGGGNQSYYP